MTSTPQTTRPREQIWLEAAPWAALEDTAPLPEHERAALVSGACYSIRVPRLARDLGCPHCGAPFLAAGPTGYADGEPICDRCLLEGSAQLGMLMALAAMTRGFGGLGPVTERHRIDLLVELGRFARLYSRFAARYAPLRPFHFEDLEGRL